MISNKYINRSSWRKVKPIFLSMSHYIHEIKQIHSITDLRKWIYFKYPYVFPTATLPPYITIELTTKCNLQCKHCWRSISLEERGIGSIPTETFIKIIDEINFSQHLPEVIKIGGAGEPALHPDFSKLMSYLEILRKHKIHVIVYTNGTLFELFSPEEIAKWNIKRIVVSVDGVDAITYEKIRLGGNYYKINGYVDEFRKYRKKHTLSSPWIEIRHVIMEDESLLQLLRFKKVWQYPGDTVKFQYLQTFKKKSDQLIVTKHRGLWREFSIAWNGNAPVFNRGFEYLGNINTETIEDVWYRMRKYLKNLK